MHSRPSFTLIELLVVIAIVGILAGIIIVSMAGATNQATFAKAKVFANSMRDSMAQSIVSEWKFDGNANDTWGSNNGTWTGPSGANTTANYRPESECVFGQCLNLDGTDDYVDCGNNDSLSPTNSITVSGWVKSTTPKSGLGVITKGPATGDYDYMLYLSTSTFTFYLKDTTGANRAAKTTTIVWADGQWHYFAGSFNNGTIYLYVDGQLRETSSTTLINIRNSTNSLLIGKGWGQILAGSIDEVRIYNSAISTAQIRQNYLAGLNSLVAKNQITKKEYNQKMSTLENYCILK